MQRGMKERKKRSSCLTLSCHFTHTHTEKMCTHAFMYAGVGGGKGACQRALVKSQLHIMSSSAFSFLASFLPSLLPSTCPPWIFLLHFTVAQAAGTLRHASPGEHLRAPFPLANTVSHNATLTFTIFPFIYFVALAVPLSASLSAPLSAHLPLLFVTVLFDINMVVVAAFAVVVVAVPAHSPTHRLAHYFLCFHSTQELPLNWATPLRFRLLNLRCHTPSSSLSSRQLLLLSSLWQHLTNDPARQASRQAAKRTHHFSAELCQSRRRLSNIIDVFGFLWYLNRPTPCWEMCLNLRGAMVRREGKVG